MLPMMKSNLQNEKENENENKFSFKIYRVLSEAKILKELDGWK